MNEAKSVSISPKAHVVTAAVDFHATGVSGGADKKQRIQPGRIRSLLDQDLDLVVGRSIN
ncbi:MAG: hypothetical protein ACU843_07105 [Gammaproteobacteria bacterium]